MNVLSLFDGCAMAYCALERAGIKVDNYYASEIDKYAVKVALDNFPKIIQMGNIMNLNNWDFSPGYDWEFPRLDLIIAGFPCQDLSFAGKQKGLQGERSGLFWKAVEILKYCKPKYFLFENVKMKQEYQDIISEVLGVQPIMIDSALVSAQSRKRLYWVGQHCKVDDFKCLHCQLGDENEKRGVQECSQSEGESTILGKPQGRQTNVQNLSNRVFENHSARNYQDMFATLCREEQKAKRCESEQRNEKDLPNEICATKLRETINLPKGIQTDTERKGSCREIRRKETQDNKASGIYSKKVLETVVKYGKMSCLSCDGRFDNRPHNTVDERWGEYIREFTSFVSAMQLQKTYYYKQLGVTQPEDKGILLKDILEGNEQLGCRMVGRKINVEGKRDDYNSDIPTQQYIEPRLDGKSNCLSTVAKDALVWTDRYKSYCIDANYYKGASLEQYQTKCRRQLVFTKTGENLNTYRKLSPVECERLQTLKDGYTSGVSNTQRYKILGNGFTVDVIAHILGGVL